MSDDVVRQTAKHHVLLSLKISEHKRLILFRVESIGIGKCVWRNLDLVTVKPPAYPAPQRELEASQGSHNNRVDVLSVKVRVREQLRVFCVDVRIDIGNFGRFVQCAGRRIVIYQLDPVPAGTGREVFGRHIDLRCQYPVGTAILDRNARVLGNYGHLTSSGLGHKICAHNPPILGSHHFDNGRFRLIKNLAGTSSDLN
jgi:hypothetical protein